MKSVVLRLEGPLQSWGTQGRFDIRDTDTEPSKSGVIGLVGAALGMPREDTATLGRIAALGFAVRVDREGTLLRDYHTVGAGTFRGRTDYHVHGTGVTTLTDRFYLTDACFTVALGGEQHETVEAIAAAVQSPRWPLFLGRRACPPSRPPFVALVDATPEAAVRAAPLDDRTAKAPTLRLLVECAPGEGATPRDDVPLSFTLYKRRHGRRFVRTEWLVLPGSTGGAP